MQIISMGYYSSDGKRVYLTKSYEDAKVFSTLFKGEIISTYRNFYVFL